LFITVQPALKNTEPSF